MRITTVLASIVIMIIGASVIADYVPRPTEPINLTCPQCPPCPTCEAVALPAAVKRIKPFIELCEQVGSDWVWVFHEGGEIITGFCLHEPLPEPPDPPPPPEGPQSTPDESIDL